MTPPTPDIKPGKQPPKPGTARAAFAYRDFRIIWTSNFLSSIGTWMQNVVLPAYVYSQTKSAGVVGIFIFAQLGPLLLLSIPGGVIADRFDRRKWLIFTQMMQLCGSVLLGFFAMWHSPIWCLFIAQTSVGIGNALNAPAFTAVMPSLVRPEDLGGSISLSSASVNGSRVTGPILVALMMSWGVTTSQVFMFNAATYLFVVWSVTQVVLPPNNNRREPGMKSFTAGFRVARERKSVGRMLLTMCSFSMISLPYVGLFPAVAHLAFDIPAKSVTYKWLYATWGCGALVGALAIGTVLAGTDKRKTAQQGFAFFALALTAFATARGLPMAFITGFILGISYFGTTTSLMTVMQSRLEIEIRARVMALWFMAFGGTIPIGNVIFGPLMDKFGARPILYIGAGWALFLSWFCNIKKIDDAEQQLVTQ
jgi:MFS family permease